MKVYSVSKEIIAEISETVQVRNSAFGAVRYLRAHHNWLNRPNAKNTRELTRARKLFFG